MYHVPLVILNGAGGLSIFLSKHPEFPSLLVFFFFLYSSRAKYNLINYHSSSFESFSLEKIKQKMWKENISPNAFLPEEISPWWWMQRVERNSYYRLSLIIEHRVMAISSKIHGEKLKASRLLRLPTDLQIAGRAKDEWAGLLTVSRYNRDLRKHRDYVTLRWGWIES